MREQPLNPPPKRHKVTTLSFIGAMDGKSSSERAIQQACRVASAQKQQHKKGG
jgi:hypothetical protein